ncbi:hypothetical protein [Paramicrobacterium fandaimingii]|uniref:hypothetical protein n=1 Tax=Paramicrobacterium fandaimingii TaxID=2708079 RepID=UPI00141FD8D7|nr:hypothetical protein [Microbacterium fandaimingii]
MAVLESRPFQTPSANSVAAKLDLMSPDVEFHQFNEAWSPGEPVVVQGFATLSDEFWEATAITRGEEVLLVGIAACAPARSEWREQSRFVERDGVWSAEVELSIEGSEIAVELVFDLWVVGPGRTANLREDQAIHPGAKLWQLPDSLVLPLEREEADFPTSAVSFSSTGRRAVPWMVEAVGEAEPQWSISSSVRLYVNTDLDVCSQIVDGTAGEDVYSAIGCDIQFAVLRQISVWEDSVRGDRLRSIAEEDYGSLAAFGASIAATLGIALDEGCRLARDEPSSLVNRSREALGYFRALGTR